MSTFKTQRAETGALWFVGRQPLARIGDFIGNRQPIFWSLNDPMRELNSESRSSMK